MKHYSWKKPIKIPYKTPQKELEEDKRAHRQAKYKVKLAKLKVLKQKWKILRKDRIYRRLVVRHKLKQKEKKRIKVLTAVRKKQYPLIQYNLRIYGEREDERRIFYQWTTLLPYKHKLTDEDIDNTLTEAERELEDSGWHWVDYEIIGKRYSKKGQRSLELWM